MKKFIVAAIATIIMSMPIMAAEGNVTIIANGNEVADKGIIVEGRTLVPVRGVFEEFGFNVNFEATTKTATLSKDSVVVKMTQGNTYFKINNKVITPDVPQQIINGSFMLPLRSVGEAIGAEVEWDSKTKTASLSLDDSAAALDNNDTDAAEENIDLDNSDADVAEENTDLDNENTVSKNIPPALDEAVSGAKLYKDDIYDDDGNPIMRYEGFSNTSETLDAIDQYIEVLEDYGYTLKSTSHRDSSSYYTYYLECSNSDIESLTYRDTECQMAIEAFSKDKYDWQQISVYYSPSIVENYRTVNNYVSAGSSSDSSEYSSFSSSSSNDVCTHCKGEGRIECQACLGRGTWVEIITVPHYGGLDSAGGTTREKKECSACGGTGYKDCPYC